MLTLDTSDVRPVLPDGDIASGMPRAREALADLVGKRGIAADMTGWLDLPRASRAEVPAIDDAARRIQDSNDCLVVIGIGGSYLGARTAIEALAAHASFPVLFAGNKHSIYR